MVTTNKVDFLRGGAGVELEPHPIVELSDDELRRIFGGAGGGEESSSMTGSYDTTGNPFCCDGTQVCCCNCGPPLPPSRPFVC